MCIRDRNTPSLIYPTSAVIRFTFEVSKSILIPCSIEGSMTYVWLPRKVCFCSFICFEISANFCVALCDGCQSDSSKPAVTRWCLRLGEPCITAWHKWFGYWIQQTHGPYNDTEKEKQTVLEFSPESISWTVLDTAVTLVFKINIISSSALISAYSCHENNKV